MKLLTLLRHAKSDWSAPYRSDFERPLKARGRRDAPLMGEYIANLDLVPDLIVSSPAERARQTAELFAEAASLAWKTYDEVGVAQAHYSLAIRELKDVARKELRRREDS